MEWCEVAIDKLLEVYSVEECFYKKKSALYHNVLIDAAAVNFPMSAIFWIYLLP